MLHRKIWVKRPGASATLVKIKEDDLVDDLRDMILQKYANSLGRSFDSPDITLKIVTLKDQHQREERVMGPDEQICRTLDTAYPEGQTIHEALLIDVPHRRTPKPSPRAHMPYYPEETRPYESGTDYFPQMPINQPSPAGSTNHSHESRTSQVNHAHHTSHHSISVLQTGQIPPLPSPGGTRRTHHNRPGRPGYARTHTSSPTTAANPPTIAAIAGNPALRTSRPRLDSSASDAKHTVSSTTIQPLPTPPLATTAEGAVPPTSVPTTPRVSSPGPRKKKLNPKRITTRSPSPDVKPTLSILDTSVPPINVLIVEDNQINLKLLEQFIRRLKVRWQTAVNGREAVTKWRQGGFHLVLMDIQLPIMSGLEATKEIRRLERVNNIGIFSSASSEAPTLAGSRLLAPQDVDGKEVGSDAEVDEEKEKEEDKLGDQRRLFKSPVIIVALTASNLQVDRHEALAAGCNDFLTKPVNFVWFERKVKEWGCMQALIDFDGWRKWKDYAALQQADANATNAGSGPGRKNMQDKKDKAKKAAANKKDLDRLRRGARETSTSGGTGSGSSGSTGTGTESEGTGIGMDDAMGNKENKG
ncbi:CheY-like protein [Aulographum hederae CBS 113979]|uniref:CheY-like protein n=1 Tax=Aulographum hederae CBS 113979 TaxID=1176131 RepID=A0A6G1H734_9PEZI|nr:CheY-like protein [Aulographum hederae CBS 113979]